jgi:molybdate transport system substrate-binding protein
VIISMIRSVDGAELAGPLPSELQNYITFTGAIASNTSPAGDARTLLQFLTSATALAVTKAKGLEPIAR